MRAGSWRKSKKQQDKQKFSTSFSKDTEGYRKLQPKRNSLEFDDEISALEFDPVQRDQFFVVVSESEYWPPTEETKVRLDCTSYSMSMFDKSQPINTSKVGIKGTKKGELRAPKHIISSAQQFLSDNSD